MGRPRRRRVAASRRRAVGCGRPRLVAARPRRPRRSTGTSSPPPTSRRPSTAAAGRATTTTTAATSTRSTSGGGHSSRTSRRPPSGRGSTRPMRPLARRRPPAAAGDDLQRRRLGLGLQRPPRPRDRPPSGPRAVGHPPPRSARSRTTRSARTRSRSPRGPRGRQGAVLGRRSERLRPVRRGPPATLPTRRLDRGRGHARLDGRRPCRPPRRLVRRGRRRRSTSTADRAAGARCRRRASMPGTPTQVRAARGTPVAERSADTRPAGPGFGPRSRR